jgi:hypothetical protein
VSQETSVRIIAMLVKEVGQTRAPVIPPVAGTSARR